LGGFHPVVSVELVGRITIFAMVLLCVASAVDYFVIFWSKIDRAAKSRRSPRIIYPSAKASVTAIRP